MTKEQLIQKITSRKLWLAVTNFIAMLMTANGMKDNEVAQVAALIMGAGGIIAYVFAEGWVDASNNAMVSSILSGGEFIEMGGTEQDLANPIGFYTDDIIDEEEDEFYED